MVSEDRYNREIGYIFNRFPSFQRVGASAYKPGIESIKELCARLGNPQERFRSIHIAGTNGKGSTSHIVAAVLSAGGHKTGLFTSPHLVDFRERIKVSFGCCSENTETEQAVSDNGSGAPTVFEMVPREFVYVFIVENKALFEELNVSFFEITTAMAFTWFAQVGVDIAVIECGLGGRLDSTNIITPELSVITNIGLDHCNLLGNTKEAIAGEKAGIIKPGVPVVIGEDSGVGDIFRKKAEEIGSVIVFAESIMLDGADGANIANGANGANGDEDWMSEMEFETLLGSMDLGGVCQRKNLKTVLCALAVMGVQVTNPVKNAIANAAALTGLHGRWEILCRSPFIVCDTGHNAHGFAILGRQIVDSFTVWKENVLENRQKSPRGAAPIYGDAVGTEDASPRLFMIFGVMADKNLDSIVNFLPKGEAHYLFVAPNTPRAMVAAKLCKKMTALGFNGEVVGSGDVAGTLEWYRGQSRKSDFVFIGGSTFVVADALVATGK